MGTSLIPPCSPLSSPTPFAFFCCASGSRANPYLMLAPWAWSILWGIPVLVAGAEDQSTVLMEGRLGVKRQGEGKSTSSPSFRFHYSGESPSPPPPQCLLHLMVHVAAVSDQYLYIDGSKIYLPSSHIYLGKSDTYPIDTGAPVAQGGRRGAPFYHAYAATDNRQMIVVGGVDFLSDWDQNLDREDAWAQGLGVARPAMEGLLLS